MCVDVPPAALSQSRHTSRGMHAHEMMPRAIAKPRLWQRYCGDCCITCARMHVYMVEGVQKPRLWQSCCSGGQILCYSRQRPRT